MRNPYTINPQDISPEMVTSLLEGRIAEAAGKAKVLPVRRSKENLASIIAGLDLSTEEGRNRKALLLQRDKAQAADYKDANSTPIKTHGTVSNADGTTELGQGGVAVASNAAARNAQNPKDLENSHNTYDSDDNSIRLELKLRTTKKKFAGGKLGKKSQEFPTGGKMTGKEKKGLRKLAGKNEKVATHGDLSNLVSAHDEPVEEGGTVAPNLQTVANMTMSKAEQKKIAARRKAYNDSKVKVESFKQYSEKTHSGLKRRTVTGA